MSLWLTPPFACQLLGDAEADARRGENVFDGRGGAPPLAQGADELQDLLVGAAAQVFRRGLVGVLFRFEAPAAPAVQ